MKPIRNFMDSIVNFQIVGIKMKYLIKSGLICTLPQKLAVCLSSYNFSMQIQV